MTRIVFFCWLGLFATITWWSRNAQGDLIVIRSTVAHELRGGGVDCTRYLLVDTCEKCEDNTRCSTSGPLYVCEVMSGTPCKNCEAYSAVPCGGVVLSYAGVTGCMGNPTGMLGGCPKDKVSNSASNGSCTPPDRECVP